MSPVTIIGVEPDKEETAAQIPANMCPPSRIGCAIASGTPFSDSAPTVVSIMSHPYPAALAQLGAGSLGTRKNRDR